MARWFLIFIFLIFSWAIRAGAQIIVFPFEDLTQDVNGVNFSVSQEVAQALEERGFKVIPPDQVLDFLAENRIRWTGWVDRITAIKAARKYNANLILVGTVTEFRRENEPILGLTLRLIRAPDYKVIWSRTKALSSKEEISLLNLKVFNSEKIMAKVVNSLIDQLPEELQQGLTQPPEIEIADIFLNPRRVQGDHFIECAVRLDVSGPSPEEVFFLWDKYKIRAFKENSLYVAKWKAPRKEGRYPINLLVRWPNLGIKKELFLSSFIVDNSPPRIKLRCIFGKKLPEGIAFSRFITLVPSFERPEPIARWVFEITSEKNHRVVIHEERPGHLPESFTWRGIDLGGHFLPNGRYKAKIIVWDLAGNRAEAEKELLLVKGAPPVSVVAKEWSEKIQIDLHLGEHPLPISFWRLELWDKDGNLLGEYEGEGKPKLITIPKRDNLFYSLDVQDTLGNRLYVRYKKLKPIILQASEEKKRAEKKWVDDF